MSVQTEINRISGNVADALAALAEKGVTVPTGAKSDNLAELIAAIEAGGGGADVNSGFDAVTSGTFTLSADKKGSAYTSIGYDEAKLLGDNFRYKMGIVWCPEILVSEYVPSVNAITIGVAYSDDHYFDIDTKYPHYSVWGYKNISGKLSYGGYGLTSQMTTGIKIYAASQYFVSSVTYKWIGWGNFI